MKYLNYVLTLEAIRGNAREVCKESDRNCYTMYRTDRDGERAIDDDRAVEGETIYQLA